MTFSVIIDRKVIKDDLPRLSSTERQTILIAIEKKLTTHPNIFGKPLRGTLKNHWSLRVGDYRVVYRMSGNTVNIFAIELRPSVYQTARKRVM